jgi:hypothetical protein
MKNIVSVGSTWIMSGMEWAMKVEEILRATPADRVVPVAHIIAISDLNTRGCGSVTTNLATTG